MGVIAESEGTGRPGQSAWGAGVLAQRLDILLESACLCSADSLPSELVHTNPCGL